jgi:magnesium-transporting ATPase (P-type)
VCAEKLSELERACILSKPWHALKTGETLEELKSSEKGLGSQEATNRLAIYGPNELKKKKGKSPIGFFWTNLPMSS